MSATVRGERAAERGYREQVHRVFLAGVGAIVLVQEEIEEFLDRLVKKGEEAERDGRRMVLAAVGRRRRDVGAGLKVLGSIARGSVNLTLKRMCLMTKSDVKELSKQLDALEEMVDRLEAVAKE